MRRRREKQVLSDLNSKWIAKLSLPTSHIGTPSATNSRAVKPPKTRRSKPRHGYPELKDMAYRQVAANSLPEKAYILSVGGGIAEQTSSTLSEPDIDFNVGCYLDHEIMNQLQIVKATNKGTTCSYYCLQVKENEKMCGIISHC